MGYNTLPAPSLPSEAPDPFPAEGAAPPPQLAVQELGRWDSEAGSGLVGPPRSFGSGRTMGPPVPPPLRRVEQQPRLIQRMESGYESSERNSSSPDRLGGAFCGLAPSRWAAVKRVFCMVFRREVGQQKRVLMSGPSWRSVPKSKSSGAILQELPSPGWGRGTNAGVLFERLGRRRRRRCGLMKASSRV